MFPLFLGVVAVSSKWISRIQEVEQFIDCPYEFLTVGWEPLNSSSFIDESRKFLAYTADEFSVAKATFILFFSNCKCFLVNLSPVLNSSASCIL